MIHDKTRKITGTAILMAIVVVLQLLGSFIKFGPFSISLVLVPIAIGAILFGPLSGFILGLTFGIVVLLSGDAAAFLAVNIPGTIITVLTKGSLAGLLSGIAYKLIHNKKIGSFVAGLLCPIINTGLFLVGCLLFFMPTINAWSNAAGFKNVGAFMIIGLVGANFIFELFVNILLSPTISHIINRWYTRYNEG